MLPPSSASISSIIFLLVGFGPLHEIIEKSGVRVFLSLFMFRNQHRENRRQEHKNQRLYKSHQHFQEIKWNRQDGREPWIHGRHCFQNAFAGINVTEQSET